MAAASPKKTEWKSFIRLFLNNDVDIGTRSMHISMTNATNKSGPYSCYNATILVFDTSQEFEKIRNLLSRYAPSSRVFKAIDRDVWQYFNSPANGKNYLSLNSQAKLKNFTEELFDILIKNLEINEAIYRNKCKEYEILKDAYNKLLLQLR